MPDLTREELEQKCKQVAHAIVCSWSNTLMGLNKYNGNLLASDIATAVYAEALPRIAMDVRVRELEKERARLITLTQMQDAFITEKSGLAAERLAEVNRLAFELQTFKDGLEEETHG